MLQLGYGNIHRLRTREAGQQPCCPLVQHIIERLSHEDSLLIQGLGQEFSAKVAQRNWTANFFAATAATLAGPSFTHRSRDHRVACVQRVLLTAATELDEDTRSLVTFLSMCTSNVLSEVHVEEGSYTWLPFLTAESCKILADRTIEDKFWRQSIVSAYYGAVLGRLFLFRPSAAELHAQVAAVVSQNPCEEEDRLLAETLSRALDFVGLQLLNPYGGLSKRERWRSLIEPAFSRALAAFDPSKESDRDILRVLIATTVAHLMIEAYLHEENALDAVKTLLQVAMEYELVDSRLQEMIARAPMDVHEAFATALADDQPQDSVSGLSSYSDMVVHEAYAGLAKSMLDCCHEIGKESDAFSPSRATHRQLRAFKRRMVGRIQGLADQLGTFPQRTGAIDSFEIALREYLVEWGNCYDILIRASTTNSRTLLDEFADRWDGVRRDLWQKVIEAIPPTMSVPSLEQALNTALHLRERARGEG